MPRVQEKALWGLVACIFLLTQGHASRASALDYVVQYTDEGARRTVEVTSCSSSVLPLALFIDGAEINFEPVASTDNCRTFQAIADSGRDDTLVLLSIEGESALLPLEHSAQNTWSLSPEVKSVLIFVGGLLAAMIGRVLNLLLDPIYHTIRVQIKYRATKKFFLSVSDSFNKNFSISEDLRRVAAGDYLTNFLLTTAKREKIKMLLDHIESWKDGNMNPSEFRERLSRL